MPKFLTLLSEEEHKMLLKHFAESPTKRNISYFDTYDQVLKNKGFTLKVEHTTQGGYKLKLKKHNKNNHILIEEISENDFESLQQTITSFSDPLTKFLKKNSKKPVMKLGTIFIKEILRKEPRVEGAWLVHENLYPSGDEEKVLGISYRDGEKSLAESLFRDTLRGFGLQERPVEKSRRDFLFLK